ncbi:FAD-dependent oxidoreductase [Nocardia terpenica]|uniref:NAD(P)/FAD-dependent oxidoreductase n=1 Tax=Nocardia terpenica TaxID=455432 RepID=UPI002FE2272A
MTSEFVTPWRPCPAAPRPALRGERRCATAVVGGGLAGLSVAVALAELDPGHETVLLEAAQIGAGASGRGTGLVGPRVGPPLRRVRRRHGDEVARAAYLASVRAVQRVAERIDRYDIDCAATGGDQLLVGTGATATELAADTRCALDLDLPVREVAAQTLPPGYDYGVRHGPALTVDPLALTTGLAAVAERGGTVVYEHSPVRAVRSGPPIRLETPEGAVTADRVVFALNAFAGAHGLLGVRVQAAATAPLPESALAGLPWLRSGPILEFGTLAPYFRLTPDRRIVLGGGAARRGVRGDRPLDRRALEAALRRLGSGAPIALGHAWSGPIAMTRDDWPVVGPVAADDAMLVAGGWCGHGLALTAAAGAWLAERIVHGEPVAGTAARLPWERGAGPALPTGTVPERVLDRYLARVSARAYRRAPQSGEGRRGVRA